MRRVLTSKERDGVEADLLKEETARTKAKSWERGSHVSLIHSTNIEGMPREPDSKTDTGVS